MAEAPWMSRWQRSPRQDRRVVENGKFVELGKVQIPEPPVEDVPVREESALEIVTEVPKVPEREQSVSEASQAELEPLPVVQSASDIALHGVVPSEETLTEEQSDALAETLRLPEPFDDEVQK